MREKGFMSQDSDPEQDWRGRFLSGHFFLISDPDPLVGGSVPDPVNINPCPQLCTFQHFFVLV
mgnify:CR=1 FL=1